MIINISDTEAGRRTFTVANRNQVSNINYLASYFFSFFKCLFVTNIADHFTNNSVVFGKPSFSAMISYALLVLS